MHINSLNWTNLRNVQMKVHRMLYIVRMFARTYTKYIFSKCTVIVRVVYYILFDIQCWLGPLN